MGHHLLAFFSLKVTSFHVIVHGRCIVATRAVCAHVIDPPLLNSRITQYAIKLGNASQRLQVSVCGEVNSRHAQLVRHCRPV